jgi:hypothetical protein
MRRSRFGEEPIIAILREQEAPYLHTMLDLALSDAHPDAGRKSDRTAAGCAIFFRSDYVAGCRSNAVTAWSFNRRRGDCDLACGHFVEISGCATAPKPL